jgi:hypothetical protein
METRPATTPRGRRHRPATVETSIGRGAAASQTGIGVVREARTAARLERALIWP